MLLTVYLSEVAGVTVMNQLLQTMMIGHSHHVIEIRGYSGIQLQVNRFPKPYLTF